ncbi:MULTISPECIES: hypothetical protein [unclassified Microcoleus]|uniref:hypothetical protein n=1 Tax=unclassified Microcoleus TaxID=2642155 RepID=UPI002FCFF37B
MANFKEASLFCNKHFFTVRVGAIALLKVLFIFQFPGNFPNWRLRHGRSIAQRVKT